MFSEQENEHLKQTNDDRKYIKLLFDKCFTDIFFQTKHAEGFGAAACLKAIESTRMYFVAKGNLYGVSFCVSRNVNYEHIRSFQRCTIFV